MENIRNCFQKVARISEINKKVEEIMTATILKFQVSISFEQTIPKFTTYISAFYEYNNWNTCPGYLDTQVKQGKFFSRETPEDQQTK